MGDNGGSVDWWGYEREVQNGWQFSYKTLMYQTIKPKQLSLVFDRAQFQKSHYHKKKVTELCATATSSHGNVIQTRVRLAPPPLTYKIIIDPSLQKTKHFLPWIQTYDDAAMANTNKNKMNKNVSKLFAVIRFTPNRMVRNNRPCDVLNPVLKT